MIADVEKLSHRRNILYFDLCPQSGVLRGLYKNIDFSSCSATFFGAKQEPGVVDLNEGLDPVGGGKLGVATPEVY